MVVLTINSFLYLIIVSLLCTALEWGVYLLYLALHLKCLAEPSTQQVLKSSLSKSMNKGTVFSMIPPLPDYTPVDQNTSSLKVGKKRM
jgi:hypothetical protein